MPLVHFGPASEGKVMSAGPVVVEGLVRPDGTLEVGEKLALPPGPVQITVVSLPELPKDDPFWQRMQGIWDARRKAGLTPRTEQQVEQERQQAREEWDERLRPIEGRPPGDPSGDQSP
jgi:hypothetical protein